jgi:hypothetical protein
MSGITEKEREEISKRANTKFLVGELTCFLNNMIAHGDYAMLDDYFNHGVVILKINKIANGINVTSIPVQSLNTQNPHSVIKYER